MKKLTQCICLMLIISLVFPVTVFAAEDTEHRASSYFMADSCYLSKKSSTEFEVWYDVKGLGVMDEIGAKTVKVQRSTDGVNWTTVKTYTMDDYPEMIDTNTGIHGCGLKYSSAESGYYYRGYVQFYAKDSDGSATLVRYTSKLKF